MCFPDDVKNIKKVYEKGPRMSAPNIIQVLPKSLWGPYKQMYICSNFCYAIFLAAHGLAKVDAITI